MKGLPASPALWGLCPGMQVTRAKVRGEQGSVAQLPEGSGCGHKNGELHSSSEVNHPLSREVHRPCDLRISGKTVINFTCPIQSMSGCTVICGFTMCEALFWKWGYDGGQIDLEVLEQCFSKLATRRNHLGDLLNIPMPRLLMGPLKLEKYLVAGQDMTTF